MKLFHKESTLWLNECLSFITCKSSHNNNVLKIITLNIITLYHPSKILLITNLPTPLVNLLQTCHKLADTNFCYFICYQRPKMTVKVDLRCWQNDLWCQLSVVGKMTFHWGDGVSRQNYENCMCMHMVRT